MTDSRSARAIHDANPLVGIPVFDEAGASHSIETLWADRPVVLALVRHFG